MISFSSRRPVAVEEAETRALVEAEQEAARVQLDNHQTRIVSDLEKLLERARAGLLEGLLLISRDVESGLFMTHAQLSTYVLPPGAILSWLGVYEALRSELAEAATMAPCMTIDGLKLDPIHDIQIADDDDGEDE